jgi:hypothetical protein
MQPVRLQQPVLHHVTRVEPLNELICYHHHWPLQRHQYRNIRHFHLHDVDRLKTPEPANLISVFGTEEFTNRSPTCM